MSVKRTHLWFLGQVPLLDTATNLQGEVVWFFISILVGNCIFHAHDLFNVRKRNLQVGVSYVVVLNLDQCHRMDITPQVCFSSHANFASKETHATTLPALPPSHTVILD